MKRFTKIATIVATILIVIGVGCIAASFAMGLTFGTIKEMLNDGKFSIGSHTFHLFDDDSPRTENLKADCRNLEIELAAGILEIYYSDIDEIQIDEEGVPGFESYIKDDTLYIKGETKLSVDGDGAKVTVAIPDKMQFQEVELELGAGKTVVSELNANQIKIELGAGQTVFENLSTEQLEAEVGAGQLQVTLDGSEADYSYDIECGIGKIQIGDHSFSGIGESQKNMNTEKLIDLECAIGEIQISFTK